MRQTYTKLLFWIERRLSAQRSKINCLLNEHPDPNLVDYLRYFIERVLWNMIKELKISERRNMEMIIFHRTLSIKEMRKIIERGLDQEVHSKWDF